MGLHDSSSIRITPQSNTVTQRWNSLPFDPTWLALTLPDLTLADPALGDLTPAGPALSDLTPADPALRYLILAGSALSDLTLG